MEGLTTNLDLFLFLKKENALSNPNVLFEKLCSILSVPEQDRTKVKLFCETYVVSDMFNRWENSSHSFKEFVSKNKNWFYLEISWPECVRMLIPSTAADHGESSTSGSEELHESAPSSSAGTPTSSLKVSPAESLNPQKIAELCSEYDFEELVYATIASVFKGKQRDDMEYIFKYLLENPSEAARIKERFVDKPKLSTEKALRLIDEAKLSKMQYCGLRASTLELGHNLYPPYSEIRRAKRLRAKKTAPVTEVETKKSPRGGAQRKCEESSSSDYDYDTD